MAAAADIQAIAPQMEQKNMFEYKLYDYQFSWNEFIGMAACLWKIVWRWICGWGTYKATKLFKRDAEI